MLGIGGTWPFPSEPKPWYRAMADVYAHAAAHLDPDEYARAVLLRERWSERRGHLDWADERAMRRLRFARWLYQHERTGEYEVRVTE